MKIITSPQPVPVRADLFLAGGISNCPLWQDEAITLLADTPGTALNPRRRKGLDLVSEEASKQIEWEYNALRVCDTVLFWFPQESLCPIALFELGVFTQRPNVNLVVGAHENYARRFDVVRQLSLARPEVIVQSLLTEVVADYLAL